MFMDDLLTQVFVVPALLAVATILAIPLSFVLLGPPLEKFLGEFDNPIAKFLYRLVWTGWGASDDESTNSGPRVKRGARGGIYTDDVTKDGRPYRRYF